MPYHKNKQQAFQAAEQGVKEAKDVWNELEETSPDYGRQLQQLKKEVNEARQQIENAHEVASETQRKKLRQYERELDSIVMDIHDKE